jgi:hypothetical protein
VLDPYSNSVTLKCKKSDDTVLIIENIIKNETIIEIDDPKVIKYLSFDPKYQEVI